MDKRKHTFPPVNKTLKFFFLLHKLQQIVWSVVLCLFSGIEVTHLIYVAACCSPWIKYVQFYCVSPGCLQYQKLCHNSNIANEVGWGVTHLIVLFVG